MDKIKKIKDLIMMTNNSTFFLGLIIVTIIVIMFIIILSNKNKKWLLYLSIPTILTALFFLLFKQIIAFVITILSRKDQNIITSLLNTLIDSFNDGFFIYGIILLVIGILLLIIYFIFTKKQKK